MCADSLSTLQVAIETAFANGEQCGRARKQRDEARARSSKEWFNRWLTLQPASDRKQLQDAWDAGYRAGAHDGLRDVYIRDCKRLGR